MLCKIFEFFGGLGRFEVRNKSCSERNVGAARETVGIYTPLGDTSYFGCVAVDVMVDANG